MFIYTPEAFAKYFNDCHIFRKPICDVKSYGLADFTKKMGVEEL
jgi:hypothetical protein